jgi:nicotinate phosphoribosyltransferase
MGTALITDLYELTMAQSYLEREKTGSAVFSLFIRSLPEKRNFLVACGLETLVERLEQFRFGSDDLTYLSGLRIFSDDFLDWLKAYRFTGNLSAVAEGTIVFQNEPLIQIEGSLPEVQILETLAINCMQYQTMAASKAARIVAVSRDKSVIDFGLRRSHMADAGISAARAAYIAGFSGTSNLEAGKRYGIPVFGTMAHSYVMAFSNEEEAFRAFSSTFPDRSLFLIDTYDTRSCIQKVISLARSGIPVTGVRLDSGDIREEAIHVRRILDDAGLRHVKIFVSSNVDEYTIDGWLGEGVPLDSFGVGTHFITSSDAPFLDIVYKLVEYEGRPVFKTSPGKTTFPFRRQIVRKYQDGTMSGDHVIRTGETSGGTCLVFDVVRQGRRVVPNPPLESIRNHMSEELAALPPKLRTLEKSPYPVCIKSYPHTH